MMPTNPLISIIIPVYNRQNCIEECINSVLAQSYQNFEIIIVDDGSTDSTPIICTQLAVNDTRIKFYEILHQGVSAARNFALEVSDGDAIFFLDSDDIIHPHLLEALVYGLVEHNTDISATDVSLINNQNWHELKERLNKSTAIGTISKLSNAEAIEAMFKDASPLGCIGGVMISKALIGETRFSTDFHISEDYYFIYQNIIKGANVSFLKEKWYFIKTANERSSYHYNFESFWSRFHRRELVWQNEENLGRNEYACLQKKDAFNCFLICISHNKPFSEDAKKMRKVLKKYRSTILPNLSFKSKILYNICSYLPLITRIICSKK